MFLARNKRTYAMQLVMKAMREFREIMFMFSPRNDLMEQPNRPNGPTNVIFNKKLFVKLSLERSSRSRESLIRKTFMLMAFDKIFPLSSIKPHSMQ